jgi:hypothetical protein
MAVMMPTLLLIIGAVALFYAVRLVAETYYECQPAQVVRCPRTGKPVRVQLDATLAALTALPGPPKLLVKECELWPEHQDCGQCCIPSASKGDGR